MSLYTFLKFLHIVFAIVAIGFNVSYGIWLRRAATEPEHAAHILRGVRLLDDRFATPAYVLLLVTGVLMVFVATSLLAPSGSPPGLSSTWSSSWARCSSIRRR